MVAIINELHAQKPVMETAFIAYALGLGVAEGANHIAVFIDYGEIIVELVSGTQVIAHRVAVGERACRAFKGQEVAVRLAVGAHPPVVGIIGL